MEHENKKKKKKNSNCKDILLILKRTIPFTRLLVIPILCPRPSWMKKKINQKTNENETLSNPTMTYDI